MKARITVIDDDRDLRSLLQIALRIEGYEVQVFANGRDFLESLDGLEPSEMYIIDINLGGITGYEICQYLKSHDSTRNSQVILVSANPEVQQYSEEVKSDDYLIKPFSQKELMQRIAKLLANRNGI
jgi:DNA-binding response OmpR family regulator